MEYTVVTSTSIIELINNVNSKLTEGWVVQGGVSEGWISNGGEKFIRFSQGLIKK